MPIEIAGGRRKDRFTVEPTPVVIFAVSATSAASAPSPVATGGGDAFSDTFSDTF